MVFPVDLERVEGGLAFKLREGKPVLVEARPIGEPFDMTFEDRPRGAGDQYGGSPRYGNFGEQFDEEMKRKGLSYGTANAYLEIGAEREVSKRKTVYGNHLPIQRPRILTQEIQLYSIDEEVARTQRKFIADFIMAWSE